MALHDVDKNGQNRLSPTINSKDNLPSDMRMAHGTTQVTNKDEQDTDGSVTVQESVIKSVDTNGNVVALLGYQEDGFGNSSFGFKVAQPGYDAETATDDQLVMSSAFNNFKIVYSGTINLGIVYTGTTVASGTQTKVVPHGLGYTPIVLAYATLPDANVGANQLTQLPYTNFFLSGALNGEYQASTYCVVDSTNITFYVIHHVGTDYTPLTPNWSVKYYLLRETAN